MSDKPLHILAANVTAACSRFQAVLADEPHPASAPQPPSSQHPSVIALTHLLREHGELLSRLSSGSDQPGGGRGDDQAELANMAAKRERVLTQGLHALGSIAVSMRAVLDDVEELVPTDNGYLPNVQELLAYGHRMRYTTFATTGLYGGEPAPQQLHLDHAALWERALAERHQRMANAAAAADASATAAATAASPPVPVDPRAEAACRTLLGNLVDAGWTPDAGFPEPVLAFLSDMPGAMDVLRRLVEERFFGGAGRGGAAEAAEAAGAGAGGERRAAEAVPPPAPAAVAVAGKVAGKVAAAAAPAANPSSRLVRELMLDEDSDDGGSEFTTTEDDSD